MSISEQLKQIKQNIQEALGRSPHGIRKIHMMGACKAQSLNLIREAAELGVTTMGENYAQELLRKAPLCMDTDIEWHFIGKLQSNKIKHILPYVKSIDSVDSLEQVQKISRLKEQLAINRKFIPIMIQVNVGNERQKSGLPPQVVEDLFGEFTTQEGVEVTGLMTIPPVYKDPEKGREHFKQMKEMFDRLKEKHPRKENFYFLSMGMSGDYKVAIEEGANFIRLGTALFGPRPAS